MTEAGEHRVSCSGDVNDLLLRCGKENGWLTGGGQERTGLSEAHPDMANAMIVEP